MQSFARPSAVGPGRTTPGPVKLERRSNERIEDSAGDASIPLGGKVPVVGEEERLGFSFPIHDVEEIKDWNALATAPGDDHLPWLSTLGPGADKAAGNRLSGIDDDDGKCGITRSSQVGALSE